MSKFCVPMTGTYSCSSRNLVIDLAKCIAAFMVVGIHSSLFRDIDVDLYFYVNSVLFRLGVPFFAAVSGYYVYESIAKKGFTIIVKQEKKLLVLYGICVVLFFLYLLPNWIATDYLNICALKGYLSSTILFGCYFHLWYLVDVIYILPVFYLLIKYIKSHKSLLMLAILLFGMYTLNYGYSKFLPNNLRSFFSIFDSDLAIVTAPFVVLPMMLVGASIAANKKNGTTHILPKCFLLILSFLLLTVEASFLRCNGKTNVTRIFSILPCTFMIMNVLLSVVFNAKHNVINFGKISLYIYIVHPMFTQFFLKTNLSSIIVFLVSCIGSVVVAYLFDYARCGLNAKVSIR